MSKLVLIVDDNETNIDLLRSMLGVKGYNTFDCNSGESALQWLQTNTPDVILLDVKMPYMDGYEVCQRIKSNPQTNSIPVVFVSALGEQVDYGRIREVGGDDYLMKPVTMKQVADIVAKHV